MGNQLTTLTLPKNIIIPNPATYNDLVICLNNPLVTVNIPLSQKTAIQANNHILELTGAFKFTEQHCILLK